MLGLFLFHLQGLQGHVVLLSMMLCEAYKVGWDFVIAPEQQGSQPHQNYAALHTGEEASC